MQANASPHGQFYELGNSVNDLVNLLNLTEEEFQSKYRPRVVGDTFFAAYFRDLGAPLRVTLAADFFAPSNQAMFGVTHVVKNDPSRIAIDLSAMEEFEEKSRHCASTAKWRKGSFNS
ncbi:hypothetical protein [Mesorhizobium sp.]|uniref:hypothetical protein n=1 Tax=Mesorhizobium sp. TaxID=1871066 RepID=UPI000FE4B73D|nr:hypothetical protein [Mesorhizobium sp.]RWD96008.1 MAG: hypothetical protein EOS40_34740 [Mesorhizobium sp.]